MSKKIVLEVNPMQCGKMFRRYGTINTDSRILKNKEEAKSTIALAIFTGGSDVDPFYYKESRGSQTYSRIERDIEEKEIFDQLLELQIPMFGICRGLQFLNVMAGNPLVQHVDKHAGSEHRIELIDGRKIKVNSAHHQMINPKNYGTILAKSSPHLSKRHLDGNDKEIEDLMGEIESAYFPKFNAAGVQWHPEWLNENEDAVQICYEIVDTFLIPGGAKENINLKIATNL